MIIRRFAALLTVAALGAFAVAGCGGSDDSSDPLTKSEYITQADEICQGATDTLKEGQSELGDDATKDDYVTFITDSYVPELQDEASQLKDLTPPSEDEGTIDELIASLDDGIDAIDSDPEILLTEGAADPLADATEQARDYGLKVCGQG